MSVETVINSTANKPTFDFWWFPVARTGRAIEALYYDNGPLHKYDQVFGTQTQSYEYQHNSSNPNVLNMRWMGHCDKAAISVSLLSPPRRDVVFRGVTFTVRDIQGLLVKVVHSLPYHYEYIGRRYPEGPISDPSPRELYARLKEWSVRYLPVILDTDPGQQVWNYCFDFIQFDFNQQVMHIRSTGFPKENKSIRFNWSTNTWISKNIDFAWLVLADANIASRDSWPIENKNIVTPFLNPLISPRNVYDIYIQSI